MLTMTYYDYSEWILAGMFEHLGWFNRYAFNRLDLFSIANPRYHAFVAELIGIYPYIYV